MDFWFDYKVINMVEMLVDVEFFVVVVFWFGIFMVLVDLVFFVFFFVELVVVFVDVVDMGEKSVLYGLFDDLLFIFVKLINDSW